MLLLSVTFARERALLLMRIRGMRRLFDSAVEHGCAPLWASGQGDRLVGAMDFDSSGERQQSSRHDKRQKKPPSVFL